MILRWIALGVLVAGGMGTAQAEEGDFFPLEVGNRWIYQKYDVRYADILRVEEIPFKGGPEWDWRSGGHKATVSTEVIGQVQLQERSYFVVRQDWNWFLPDTLYLRKEGAQVFRYLEQPDHIGGQTILRDLGDLGTSVEQTSWGQVKSSFEEVLK